MANKSVIPPDKILFGQFLIDEKKLSMETLKAALETQSKEKDALMKESHRLLGQILFQDFNVFKDRLELNKYIKQFHEYKDNMEQIYYELRNLKDKDD